jgi:NADPH:quinone reductase-like Zn-dependent oxidoreductase
MSTMKAVRIHEYGAPSMMRYEDAPCPDVKADEVLVRVAAAGVNPVDWKTRQGSGMAGRYGKPFPLIVGWDVAGTIEAVGADVHNFQVGDTVFGMVRFPEIGSAYAEYVAAPAAHLAKIPTGVDMIQAAAAPLVALTAWQALFEAADLQAGQRVLIHAAAGGVGHLAVQLAKWKGAFVIGTASPENAAFLQEFGVDQIVDYHRGSLQDVIQPVDVVMDNVGGETLDASYGLVREGGTLVTIAGGIDQNKAAAHRIHGKGILVRPVAEHLEQIAALMQSGALKVEIAKVFPLRDVQAAHGLSESRHLRGKIVLQVNAS